MIIAKEFETDDICDAIKAFKTLINPKVHFGTPAFTSNPYYIVGFYMGL